MHGKGMINQINTAKEIIKLNVCIIIFNLNIFLAFKLRFNNFLTKNTDSRCSTSNNWPRIDKYIISLSGFPARFRTLCRIACQSRPRESPPLITALRVLASMQPKRAVYNWFLSINKHRHTHALIRQACVCSNFPTLTHVCASAAVGNGNFPTQRKAKAAYAGWCWSSSIEKEKRKIAAKLPVQMI